MEWKNVVVFVYSPATSMRFIEHKLLPWICLLHNCYRLIKYRSASFKEDDGTWKGNDDGKVVNNQPQRVMDDRNGMMPQAGYIGRFVQCSCYFFVYIFLCSFWRWFVLVLIRQIWTIEARRNWLYIFTETLKWLRYRPAK